MKPLYDPAGTIPAGRRPFTGAWIETHRKPGIKAVHGRPFTGAWIETKQFRRSNRRQWVAPSRGRGLKPRLKRDIPALLRSPLHGGVD